MATLQAYASSFNNATPTGFTGGQLTSPANAQGAPDATLSITTGATQNADYGNHFYFADLANIPAGATINSVTLTPRNRITTVARGDYFYRLDSSPNNQIATEWAPSKVNTLGDQSNSTWSTVPTLAQLQASTFGVRARYRRTASQTASFELDAVALLVDYTPPTTTKNSGGAAAMVLTPGTLQVVKTRKVVPSVSAMVLAGDALITKSSGEPEYKPSGGAAALLLSATEVLAPVKVRRFGPERIV